MDYSDVGLSREEYDALVEFLRREPNETELRLFGVMWSEHCSYKSTRPLLKQFLTSGPTVLQGPGENAGVVDLGKGWGLAFKVESHNHPSAVEPYQGAATGVGGIIRDILAMGARPVASLDGLFFGSPEDPRSNALARGIVKGVGGYGNSVGVPTVGGKAFYHEGYNKNPLVNAFCAGVVKLENLVSSQTAKPGQKVLLLGAKTGRDGIAGAAFASVELNEDTRQSRPQVQIGDPFTEKRLIECCLELLERKLIASMQDMGAAGVLSSSSEVASKSGVGMILDLDKVPQRETDMQGWEIALSESQERMLLVVDPPKIGAVVEIAEKWDLDCTEFGIVTEAEEYVLREKGTVVASLPPDLIGGNAPVIHWAAREPEDLGVRSIVPPMAPPENWNELLISLLRSPSLGKKNWIWEQYDYMVQTNTVEGPGKPVSVIRIPPSENFVAFSMEADPWKCFISPYDGGAETVAKALRSLAVAGASPLGLTDCLNFPSPEKSSQFWELQQCVAGMAECSKVLECPVVSGNVSLYNEYPGGRILPTPLVVAAGLLSSIDNYIPAGNWKQHDRVFLVGELEAAFGGTHYAYARTGSFYGPLLPFDPEMEKDFFSRALETAAKRAATSGRTVAGGGLGVALAKEVIACGLGLHVAITAPVHLEAFYFSEGGPRAIYAVPPEKVPEFLSIWEKFPLMELGTVRGTHLHGMGAFNIPVATLRKVWEE